MNHHWTRNQQRSGRRTVVARKRRRFQPTLVGLEDRKLLSMFVVDNPTDMPVAGETDLRQAIALANTNGGAETITFDKTVFRTPQTIELNPALGQLELSDQTGTETITGPRAGVTIKGNYTTSGAANSVFEIEPGATATLSGLTITGGNNPIFGGGVDDYGTATLIDCTNKTAAIGVICATASPDSDISEINMKFSGSRRLMASKAARPGPATGMWPPEEKKIASSASSNASNAKNARLE